MINIPEIVPDVRQHLDARELYALVQRFLNLQLFDYDAEDLLALDDYRDPDSGLVTPSKVRHELRLTQVFFSEAGLIGKCSQRQFLGILQYAYENEVKTLEKEQPGCSWRLAAAEIQRVNIRTTREIAYDGPTFSVDQLLSFVGSKEPVAHERKIAYDQIPDYRCVVPLVFVDIAQGDLVDPAINSPQGREGPMTRYAATRNIRHLTDSQRKTRIVAESLVRELDKRRKQGPALPKPTEMGPDHQAETIESLRARIRELEARDKAHGPSLVREPTPVPEAIQAPDPGDIAEEMADTIRKMREERQMTPDAIAGELSSLGITEPMVKAILRKRRT